MADIPLEQDRTDYAGAAAIVGVAASSLELKAQRIRLGIPHYRVGRKVFFLRSELEEWVRAHRVAAPG